MSDSPKPRLKPGAVLIGFLVLLVGEILILANSGVRIFGDGILPELISPQGKNIDTLFYVILGITLFFFVLTQALLVYFLVKYRAREGGKARHTHGNHTLEMVWTFIPGLILFSLAVFQTGTWGEMKFRGSMPERFDPTKDYGQAGPPDTVEVRVFGKQFEWHFWYPGEDRLFHTDDDVVKLGELHVPVDTWVIVDLQTRDVLHSFWLPNVRLKQDLLPGQTIPQWFLCDRTGSFEIVCAELCGIGHTRMKGQLIVESEKEWRSWLRGQVEENRKYDQLFRKDEHPIWKHWRE